MYAWVLRCMDTWALSLSCMHAWMLRCMCAVYVCMCVELFVCSVCMHECQVVCTKVRKFVFMHEFWLVYMHVCKLCVCMSTICMYAWVLWTCMYACVWVISMNEFWVICMHVCKLYVCMCVSCIYAWVLSHMYACV